MQHNCKRYDYKYRIQEQGMIKVYDPRKGNDRQYSTSPYTELNMNGTARVKQDPNVCIEEPYNL